MKKCKATPLKHGAKVGVIAPASSARNPEEVEGAVQLIRTFGLEPVLGRFVKPGDAVLAGNDRERQADLEELWRDPEVGAVWALRGGYGCIRLLARLDYRMVAEQAKILMGYSDITALEMAFWTHSRLVSFHGPVLSGLNSCFSQQLALDMLLGRVNASRLPWPVNCRESYTVIRGGRARGIILGGNLATLLSLAGTQYFPDLEGVILFIEEVGEAAYRIDRMVSQLRLMGVLEEAAAVIVGKSVPVKEEPEEALVDVFRQQLRSLPCPVAYGFPIGHVREQWTLPQGVLAEVDTELGGFTLLEQPFGNESPCKRFFPSGANFPT